MSELSCFKIAVTVFKEECSAEARLITSATQEINRVEQKGPRLVFPLKLLQMQYRIWYSIIFDFKFLTLNFKTTIPQGFPKCCIFMRGGLSPLGLSPSEKICLVCFIESPLKLIKNSFYFILKQKLLSFSRYLRVH